MKRVADRSKKYLAVICFFVFTVCLYGPFSLYFQNVGEFWFTLKDFSIVVLPVSLIALTALFLLSIVLPETKGHIMIKLLFGITLGMYIQGNYINIRYGSGVLDGSEIIWSEYSTYATWSTIVWIVCRALPFVIDIVIKHKDKMFYKVITAISLFLIAIQLPAFASQALAYAPADSKDFKITTQDMFELSDSDNILVFILDTMDERYYQEFMEAYPEYTEELEGFVHFDNASAAGSKTILAIPAMFTGTPFKRESLYSEYIHKVWSQPNALSVLHNAGYHVDFYGEAMEFSNDAAEYIDNFVQGKDAVNSYIVLADKTYKMDMFKFMPHLLKRFFWYDTAEFEEAKAGSLVNIDDMEPYSLNDPVFYSKFNEKGFTINPSREKVMQVYHLKGAHSPYVFNERGEEESSVSRLQHVIGEFSQIGCMLDELKDMGLYDNATILILADHGEKNVGEYSMFLLKEAGSKGPYHTSSAPVSYFDIPPYLASLVGKKLDNEFSMDLLNLPEDAIRERHVFYNTTGNSRIVVNEYVSSSHAGKKSNWKLVNQYEEEGSYLIEYELGSELTFGVEATGNRYAFEGFGNDTGWRTKLHGPLAELRIPIKGLPKDGNLVATIGFYNQKSDYDKAMIVEANGNVAFEGKTDKAMMKNGLNILVPVDSFKDSNILTIKLHFPEIDESEMEKEIRSRTITVSLVSLEIRVQE